MAEAAPAARIIETREVPTQGSGGNVLAALCSFFVPGLGQVAQGRFATALAWWMIYMLGAAIAFMVVSIAAEIARVSPGAGHLGGVTLAAIAVGIAAHIWQVHDAATYNPRKPRT